MSFVETARATMTPLSVHARRGSISLWDAVGENYSIPRWHVGQRRTVATPNFAPASLIFVSSVASFSP
jgi:hypothetical protein